MRPLAVTAHYDDMEVGAGGTLGRFGGFSLVLTPHKEGAPLAEATAASIALGVRLHTLGMHIPERELVQKINTTILNNGIDTIITCNPNDSHADHRWVASVAAQAARKEGTNLLYMDYAIPGGYDGTTQRPNFFVTIQPSKYDALECYESQIEKYGPRWINAVWARDQTCGFQHGVPLAEGFIVADWTL